METLQEGDELVFLYQLVPGHTDTSYACHVASMVGLPKEVVQRGAQVSHREGGRGAQVSHREGGRGESQGGGQEVSHRAPS